MKRRIKLSGKFIRAFFIISVFGCGGISIDSPKRLEDKPQSAIHGFPGWFWNMPPDESQILAVGYSENYFREESSKAQALKNGIETLAKSISVRIKGEQGFWNVGSQMAIAGDFEEAVDDEILQRVEGNYKVLRTYKSESMTIVLLSFGEISHLAPDGATQPTEGEPKWLKELPQTRGYVYAIGNSSQYFRETQSWLSAERNARVALASTLGIKLRGLVKQLDQQIEVVQATEVNVQLKRAQIVSRWIDSKMEIYYVLARMPLLNNKDVALTQINALIASPEAVIRKEGVIEKAYRGLEEEINSLEEKK